MGPVDEAKQIFTLDCYFRQFWTDERLIFNHSQVEELAMNWQFLSKVGMASICLKNKGWGKKKTPFSKFWYTIFSWTVGLKRLSFSGLGVLMRTPSPEKDSLFRPTVHEKIVYQNFEKGGVFLPHPLLLLYALWRLIVFIFLRNIAAAAISGHKIVAKTAIYCYIIPQQQ